MSHDGLWSYLQHLLLFPDTSQKNLLQILQFFPLEYILILVTPCAPT
jgi:hypothetical protein